MGVPAHAVEVYPPDMHSLVSKRFIAPVFLELAEGKEAANTWNVKLKLSIYNSRVTMMG